jgi:hypothetical protein
MEGQQQERLLELSRRGSDSGIERGCGRCATDDPGHARSEDLHRVRDAHAWSLPDIPGGDELIDAVADLVPSFIAFEAFLQPVVKLISERRSNMQPLAAARCSNDAPGKTVDAPPQVCLRVVKQLGFDVTSLGLLLSLLRLTLRLVDLALDDWLYINQGRRMAHGAERAF